MRRLRKRYGCPVELSLDLLGGKWQSVILARLKDQQLGYGDLRRAIPGLSDKVLSERLRGLEERGLIVRVSQGDMPNRAEYALTERGQSLRPVLEALYQWGQTAARDLDVTIATDIGAV